MVGWGFSAAAGVWALPQKGQKRKPSAISALHEVHFMGISLHRMATLYGMVAYWRDMRCPICAAEGKIRCGYVTMAKAKSPLAIRGKAHA